MEQFIHWEFEFLAVSYIVSGLLLLFLYGMIQDYEELLAKTKAQQQRETATEDAALRPVLTLSEWPELQLLSARERDVLDKMLEDKKRKEIAEELFVCKQFYQDLFFSFGNLIHNFLTGQYVVNIFFTKEC